MAIRDRSIDARGIAGLAHHPLTVALILGLASMQANAAAAPGPVQALGSLVWAGNTCQATSCNDSYATPYSVAKNGYTVAAPGVLANENYPPATMHVLAPLSGTTQAGGHYQFNDVGDGSGDGAFTYTAPVGFIGQDQFPYNSQYVGDGTIPGNAVVFVTVTATAPSAALDEYWVARNSVLNQAAPGLLANDIDPDGNPLSVIGVTQPSAGSVTTGSDGSFTFDASSLGIDVTENFTYTIADVNGNAKGSVLVHVIQAPNAFADSFNVPLASTPATVPAPGVLGNDATTEPGTNLSAMAETVATGMGGSASIAADGSFTYTPPSGYVGADTFVYRAFANVSSTTAVVTLQVTNSAPLAVVDHFGTTINTPLSIPANAGVLANDTDADLAHGQSLSASQVSPPSHGTLELSGDGSFVYTPAANYVGPDSFDYRASDGYDNSVATVNLVVGGGNPNAVADTYTVALKDTPYAVAAPGVLTNDNNGGAGTLEVITTGTIPTSQGGSVQQNADGSFTYTAPSGFVGADTYQYSADIGANTTATSATVTVNVTNTTTVPGTDTYATAFNTVLPVAAPGVLGNDVDPDTGKGQSLSVTGTSNPAHGTVSFSANGGFIYTPTTGYSGADSFTYTVSDGVGTATGTVNLTIAPGGPPPVLQPVPAGNVWTWLSLGTLLGMFGLRRLVPVRKRR